MFYLLHKWKCFTLSADASVWDSWYIFCGNVWLESRWLCVAQCQLFLSDIRWLWNVIYFWCSLLKLCLFHNKLCLTRAETLFPLVSSLGLYGPDEGWASAYPECRERNQSPINIVDHDTKVSTEYQELTLEGFESESSNKTSMKNTGKTGTVKTIQAQAADWNFPGYTLLIYVGSAIFSSTHTDCNVWGCRSIQSAKC